MAKRKVKATSENTPGDVRVSSENPLGLPPNEIGTSPLIKLPVSSPKAPEDKVKLSELKNPRLDEIEAKLEKLDKSIVRVFDAIRKLYELNHIAYDG